MATKRKTTAAKPGPAPPVKRATAPSPSPAALSMLTGAGVQFRQLDEHHVRVARDFLFWPATGYWRDEARTVEGQGARNLIAEIARRGDDHGSIEAIGKALANA